jgi:hypothetical protein
MAEVGILIIFVLLLLLAFDQWIREGQSLVATERLRELERSANTLAQLLAPLELSSVATANEIRRLVRVLEEARATAQGQTSLAEAKQALAQIRQIVEGLGEQGVQERVAQALEEQSYQIANQEGQLRRYEQQLRQAGLGKGERPCWVKPDGTIEYLYEVVLISEGIKMRELLHPSRQGERELLPILVTDPRETLRASEFLRRTAPLYKHSLAKNCRFFVVIYDGTGPTEKERYKSLLRTVEGHFYKRLDSGIPPF